MNSTFAHFREVSLSDIERAIGSAPNKTSPLDVLDIHILKQCPFLVPVLKNIVNDSLKFGKVSECLKTAAVTPLLKKSNLDVNTLTNYRPVSNLPFVSMLIERFVVNQLNEYLEREGLSEPFQSAYPVCHIQSGGSDTLT